MTACLLLLFLLYPVKTFSQTYKSLAENQFIIIYTEQDSASARIALNVLEKYTAEICHDLQMELKDTIKVFIAPSSKAFRGFFKGQLPKWTNAFATPLTGNMYVKSPRWEHEEDFNTALIHELFHLLLHNKTGLNEVPRWLDEGLAVFYSKDSRWITSTAISKAFTTRSLIPLAQIDNVLNFHKSKAELAYQESWSAVYYLLTTYDIDAVRIIIDSINNQEDMDTAFKKATGSSVADFEKEWKFYALKKYKWTWLTDIDNLIWLGIIILAITGLLAIRFRNRKKLQEWENDPFIE